MKFGIGVLVLCLTVYTAKSLYVGKSGETFDDVQLQQLSDVANETIGSEIKVNPLPPTVTTPRLSSLFNLSKLNLLPMRKMMESAEDDINNEIEKGDVIEIEVPVIGSEYMRRRHDNESENKLEVNEEVDGFKGYAEMNIFTTPSTLDLSTTEAQAKHVDVLTFSPDFQTSPNYEEVSENAIETTTTNNAETTLTGDVVNTKSDDDIQSMESKLMEQWKAVDSLIDDSFESELFTVKSRVYPKYPFNVKIVVNNEDEKKSCKSKKSCSQVSFSRAKHDIDPEFYADYSDEDLFFKSQPDRYFQLENELRPRNARRAADDMPFGLITPAPRFPPLNGLKKPNFIERLENESSLERSERVNKNLDGLMKFISVWAQVDRFVSDRARSAIRRIAYVAGDDYDEPIVGSRKHSVNKKSVDEPFT